MFGTTYIDSTGRYYRPVGRVPYCELTVGSVFALPGIANRVYVVRREIDSAAIPLQYKAQVDRKRNTLVILLELVEPEGGAE